MVIEDDGTVPQNSVSAFAKLLSQKVELIIGATWQHTTAALTPLAARSQMVVLNTSNFPEVVNFQEGGGYVFTNAYSIADDVGTFRRFLASRGVRKVAILRNVTNWSLVQANVYKNIAAEEKVRLLDDIQTDQIENNDWRVLLPRVKSSAPDAVVFFLGKSDVDAMLRRAREMALKPAFFGASHTYDAFKNAADKSIYEGVCLTYPLRQLREHQEFSAAYEERYHEPPQLYADSSYDALLIAAQALKFAREKGADLKTTLQSAEFKANAYDKSR